MSELSDKLNALADNPFEKYVPKHPPPSLSDPVVYDTMYYIQGWLIFFAVLAVLIVLIIVVVKIALKLLYWTTYAATRGVHDGWNGEPPVSLHPKAIMKAAIGAQMLKAMNQSQADARRLTNR